MDSVHHKTVYCRDSGVICLSVGVEPKGENASRVAEIRSGVYSADTVTANYVQFWFRRIRSGIFDVKVAPRTSRPVIEKVDKITEIIELVWHVSSHSIAQELKSNLKPVLSHLNKVGFKKKLDGQTQNSKLYCQKLDRLNLAIDQKRLELANRRGGVFH
ncbi:histone-lysine N-methyltransferase SETMAR [Trichonephila clavipes]|nr:histone-lysine N-methyltransferase SETMAR [Trichonephila clavipes]